MVVEFDVVFHTDTVAYRTAACQDGDMEHGYYHYADYRITGAIVTETHRELLPARSERAAVAKAPRNAYGFVLYDKRRDLPRVDPDFTVTPKKVNRSGVYYIDGTVYTRTGVEALPGDHSVLLDNMDTNSWDAVVHCRTGTWQPFDVDADRIVPAS